MGLVVTDVVSSYGAHYIAGGQNAQRLYKKLFYGAEVDQAFRQVKTDDTVLRFASAEASRLLQPFQKAWTPTGDLTFSPAPIQLYPVKMDFEAYPHDLEESWLGFLAGESLSPKDWPFIRWAIEEHLLPKYNEDMEMNEAYAGEFAAVTPGTPGAAGTAMNGIKKVINDHITAGDITAIATGALSATPETFVGQIESFVASIDERYRNRAMELCLNKTLELRYRQGMRIKYNTNYGQESDLLRVADHPNITIAGKSAMTGSNKIFCTPKENAICAIKKGKNKNMVMVEGEDRKVKIWSDYYKGYGFIIPDLVFTNDQDLNP